MDVQPLHPNLAQLAASYDEILDRYGRNLLAADEARSQVLALVARDDQGVQWSIDPDDGDWYRRTRDGSLVKDNPPTTGVSTPTAYDLSSPNPHSDPRRRLLTAEVQPVSESNSLTGATIRHARAAQEATSRPERNPWLPRILIGVAVIVLLVVAWYIIHQDSTPSTPTAPTAPTSATLPVPPGEPLQP